MRVMPRSTADRMVRIASISSVPPHIHPPIAHDPSPIRDTFKFVPAILADSMLLFPWPQIAFPDAAPSGILIHICSRTDRNDAFLALVRFSALVLNALQLPHSVRTV